LIRWSDGETNVIDQARGGGPRASGPGGVGARRQSWHAMGSDRLDHGARSTHHVSTARQADPGKWPAQPRRDRQGWNLRYIGRWRVLMGQNPRSGDGIGQQLG